MVLLVETSSWLIGGKGLWKQKSVSGSTLSFPCGNCIEHYCGTMCRNTCHCCWCPTSELVPDWMGEKKLWHFLSHVARSVATNIILPPISIQPFNVATWFDPTTITLVTFDHNAANAALYVHTHHHAHCITASLQTEAKGANILQAKHGWGASSKMTTFLKKNGRPNFSDHVSVQWAKVWSRI